MFAPIARTFSAALFVFAAAGAHAADLDEQLRLNSSITVADEGVHLGDIFSGYLSRPEKVVAQAPRPGQRIVLSAEWLRDIARKNGLDWQPASVYDRAVVYQPGHTISAQEILAAAKAELIAKGMPANYSVAPNAPVNPVSVSINVAADVGVREAYYDPASHSFSVVMEIPPGDPRAQFVPLRGVTYPTIAVPVLKESAPKNTVITAAMLTSTDVSEDQLRPSTITDPAYLIGKVPRIFVKAGQQIRDADVAQLSLVDVPVLTMDAQHDSTIARGQIKTIALNAADLPHDVVLDANQLVGRTPRRLLVAGAPIRRGDVQMVRQLRVPVASHDLPHGAILSQADLSWVAMNESEIANGTVTEAEDILGRETKHAMRAGQTLHGYDIARPVAVTRGKLVTIIYNVPAIKLTVQGQAIEPGGIGDVIRVSNTKSNTVVTAEIIDAHTVRIASQQTAMR